MNYIRPTVIGLLALALFAGSNGSVSGQPIDSDGDGLSDAFEAGFGVDGVEIINPETGNTATATGSAAAGSTITSGSFAVTLPPVPEGVTGIRMTVVPKGGESPLIAGFESFGSELPSLDDPKHYLMLLGNETKVCIEDKPGGTLFSIAQGPCPPPPADPNECPPGKIGIPLPPSITGVTINTKTPEPECAAATYTIFNNGTATSVEITGLHHSTVALLDEPSVGGIAEVLVDGSDSSPRTAEGAGLSGGGYAALATGTAAAALTLVLGGWYARRRWLR